MDCVAVSDDGRWFAGGRTVQDIKLFDLAAGKEARVIPLVEKPDPKGSDHVKRVEFGLSGKVLFSGSARPGRRPWTRPRASRSCRPPAGRSLTAIPGAGGLPVAAGSIGKSTSCRF